MPEVADPLGALTEAVDSLIAADPSRFADRDSITALYRQLSRVEAAVARASAAFDAGREWDHDRARSAAGWLATTTHVPKALAQRRVRLGRDLRLMDLVERAWLDGDIGEAQVNLLSRARTPKRSETFARDEELLVSQASKLSYGQFCRALAYWCYRADPDGSEDEADADFNAREVYLSDGFRGRKELKGTLDAIGGSIVADELARIDQELFDADCAEAKQRVGPGVRFADLQRTPAQRRADALVEMAPSVTSPPPTARSTTSSPMQPAASPHKTTAGRPATSTTATATDEPRPGFPNRNRAGATNFKARTNASGMARDVWDG